MLSLFSPTWTGLGTPSINSDKCPANRLVGSLLGISETSLALGSLDDAFCSSSFEDFLFDFVALGRFFLGGGAAFFTSSTSQLLTSFSLSSESLFSISYSALFADDYFLLVFPREDEIISAARDFHPDAASLALRLGADPAVVSPCDVFGEV